MNDYSDIIYLMAAMIIFSLLSINAAYFFNLNDQFQYEAELEYNGISVAQGVIDQVRWIDNSNLLNRYNSACICNDYPKTITVSFGEYEMDYNVNINISDTTITGSSASNKVIEVIVTNEFLKDNQKIRMKYLKSFIN